MAGIPEDSKDTCECYVAFFDISGTKDRIKREGHKKALATHKALFEPTKVALESLQKTPLINKQTVPITPVVFSDSIILMSEDISQRALEWTLTQAQFVLFSAIEKGIPIKGAIACGTFTFNLNNSIHFGQPLIDAYVLQNRLKLYGVILHDTVSKYLEKYNIGDTSYVIKTPVPMKYKKNIPQLHYLVDWIQHAIVKSQDPQELVKRLYSKNFGKPRKYVDNTLDFVRCVISRKEQRKPQAEVLVPISVKRKEL
jgi:hypothetical protein